MSALAAIRDDLKERIPRTVERESAKIIALKVGTTPRAVENWRQRESLHSVPAFIMLAKNDPELRAWVLHELDYEDDPERAMAVIANHLSKRGTHE